MRLSNASAPERTPRRDPVNRQKVYPQYPQQRRGIALLGWTPLSLGGAPPPSS